MKNILKTIIVLLLVFCAVGITNKTNAVERNYESNGQTSFYGKYEYENDSNDSRANWLDGSNNYLRGSNNYLSTGQVVLPSTGDYTYPVFAQVGGILLIGISVFVFIEKRKGEFDR
ncbi:hypothetical protein IGK28_000680 [Enterococcus sp. DIV0182]|uniref:LPXTG cell wall anchor domain-containing protein n=2 Tax=Enterococcus TaxID=1350 RepID=UPI0022E8EE5B|nr:LPXTG cell wall anchor domain-containing protein [Enterococcus thailandicus]